MGDQKPADSDHEEKEGTGDYDVGDIVREEVGYVVTPLKELEKNQYL